jgi:hypothetical protein
MFMPKVVRIDVDVASSQKNKGFVVTRSRSGGPELVDPIRMFIIKVGVKHPGQTEGLTDDVVKVRERR